MWNIFKWFFGIVLLILFAYLIVVAVRSLLSFTGFGSSSNTTNPSVSSSSIATSSNFSVKNWFSNWFKNSPVSSTYVPGSVIVASQNNFGSDATEEYRNPIADRLLKAYSNYDFDSRWETENSYYNENKINNTLNNDNFQKQGSVSVNKNSKIKSNLAENSSISNNQVITGYADNSVYSNRYFLIKILDKDQNLIGTIKAFMNGNAQKDGSIPFRGVLNFNTPSSSYGYLDYGNEDLAKIYFSEARMSAFPNGFPTMLFKSPVGKCVVGGCNMQFCLEQEEVMNLVSSCQYLRAYQCYRQAICERNQQTGKCGWRVDNSLATCLQNSY